MRKTSKPRDDLDDIDLIMNAEFEQEEKELQAKRQKSGGKGGKSPAVKQTGLNLFG